MIVIVILLEGRSRVKRCVRRARANQRIPGDEKVDPAYDIFHRHVLLFFLFSRAKIDVRSAKVNKNIFVADCRYCEGDLKE
jgi:hypothetical protein